MRRRPPAALFFPVNHRGKTAAGHDLTFRVSRKLRDENEKFAPAVSRGSWRPVVDNRTEQDENREKPQPWLCTTSRSRDRERVSLRSIHPPRSRLSCPLPLRERAQWCAHDFEWVRGFSQHTPHPSSHAAAPSCPLPQGERAQQRQPSSRLVAEPFSVIPISRCQTAHLVPAAHFCTRGLPLCFTHPESRGGRSAERRSGARRNSREACT